nr:hypothetical protein L204_00049 [Cryptococcus depauperatus CBS 7855]
MVSLPPSPYMLWAVSVRGLYTVWAYPMPSNKLQNVYTGPLSSVTRSFETRTGCFWLTASGRSAIYECRKLGLIHIPWPENELLPFSYSFVPIFAPFVTRATTRIYLDIKRMALTISNPHSSIWTYDPPSSPISYVGLHRLRGSHLPREGEGKSQSPATLVRESKSSGDRPDKTPSARAKVLPWVQGVQYPSEGSIPEGMFGPYPSRPQSMIDPPQSRHPYSYAMPNIPTLPFSAIGDAGHPINQDHAREMHRPESETFSRGAGMYALGGLGMGKGVGADTPGDMSATSPGMGTFGLEGKPHGVNPAIVPLPQSTMAESLDRSKFTIRKPPPSDAPPSPISKDVARPQPSSDEDEKHTEYNIHEPHRDYPFSYAAAEAQRKEAMEDARAAALAQLEAAQRTVDEELEDKMREILGMSDQPQYLSGQKGPRHTFETTTSGPSFGHILHQNGVPVSARPSMQAAPAGFSDIFRMPLGVPIGMNVPRPLMVMHDSSGAPGGLGLGGFGGIGIPGLLDILELEERERSIGKTGRSPEARSAFVETVEDVSIIQSPTRTDVRTELRSRAASGTKQRLAMQTAPPADDPQKMRERARTESGLFGQSLAVQSNGDPIQYTQFSPDSPRAHLLASKAASAVPSKHTHTSKVPAHHASSKAPTAGVDKNNNAKAHSKAPTKPGTRAPAAKSQNKAGTRIMSGSAASEGTMKAGEGKVNTAAYIPTAYEQSQPAQAMSGQWDHGSGAGTMLPQGVPTIHAQTPGFMHGQGPLAQVPHASVQEFEQTVIGNPDGVKMNSQVYATATPVIYHSSGAGQQIDSLENQEEVESVAQSLHESAAPTTMSHVKRLVDASRYHDETLCQLLDAARLNLIGEEAKKALQRAARARVIELKELREAGEVEEGLIPVSRVTPTLTEKENRVIDGVKDVKEGKRRNGRDKKGRTVGGKSVRSDKTVKEDQKEAQETPAWARDIMARLSAFDQRFAALEHQTNLPASEVQASFNSYDSGNAPRMPTKDPVFNGLPSTGLKDGIHMPNGLAHNVLSGGSQAKATTLGNLPPNSILPATVSPGQRVISGASHYSNRPISYVPIQGISSQYVSTQVPPTLASTQGISGQHPHTQQAAPTQYTYQDATGVNASTSQSRNTSGPNGPADALTWGSEVELPYPLDDVPPPLIATAPTINILAPTESNMGNGKASTRASPNSRTVSRESQPPTVAGRTLDGVQVDQQRTLPDTAVPNPREKSLPPEPSESQRSQAPNSTLFDTLTQAKIGTTMPSATIQPNVFGNFQPDQYPPQPGQPRAVSMGRAESQAPGTIYATALEPNTSNLPGQTQYFTAGPDGAFPSGTTHSMPAATQPSNAVSTAQLKLHETMTSPFTSNDNNNTPPRDRIHVVDPLHPPMGGWKPWDMLTQRLYSWALIIDEKSFVRALEDISLGRQVDAFPLSVFLMLAFKRWVRRNLSENPPQPCDKLFVPPNLAIAINVAVHSRRYHEAREILLELWDCLGQKEPPRIIVALAPLGNETDQWAAHRYDLSTKHLTTYRVSHQSEIQTDGRSFWWWEAIRQAWPQLNVPEMEELERRGGQRIINEHRPPEYKHDNSLYAANISRNLLLGYRPERQYDLVKQREIIWAEVKRLLNKKRNGRLVVEPDSPEHLYDT